MVKKNALAFIAITLASLVFCILLSLSAEESSQSLAPQKATVKLEQRPSKAKDSNLTNRPYVLTTELIESLKTFHTQVEVKLDKDLIVSFLYLRLFLQSRKYL